MKIGAIFPQNEIGNDPAVIREFAQTAEELGYAHLLAYDHVLGAHPDREPALLGPYTHEDAFHEPFVLLAYLAAATRRIGLVTGVIILPQRQTALVAKQAAEIDLLSGGRLRLGVGIGWNPVEYEALGVPFRQRGPRLEEQVEVLRQLWREPLVDFEGRWHRIDRAGIEPRPRRAIPIWFGGLSRAATARAARVGDGFLFPSYSDGRARAIQNIREAVSAGGRDPDAFGFEGFVDYASGPEAWLAEAERWKGAGATHVSMRAMGCGLEKPRDHIDALRRYWDAVGNLASP